MNIEAIVKQEIPLILVQEIELAMQRVLKQSETAKKASAGKSISETIIEVADRKRKNISDTVRDPKKVMESAFIAKQHYEMLVRKYNEFMSSYLAESLHGSAKTYEYKSEEAKEWHWGDEVISYKERQELVRSVQMNALLGGSHNHVAPHHKEAYERWKDISKFNMMMSFWMYDRVSGSS